ncbi:hypothetical protein [Sporolactobacillus nakayamae]|uniref:Uncharacterized protein n=1 Tax=Sporolactobacillus nakayamae TaxID=269670 RepID=A0A1I2U0M7_9BACL|nr:hypothetical protein [Sporolactobacillus nakayamae]SFG70715.1 hypothetical protein SAMN02982927_02508 [Sporolactobacillus nakayamae]
MYQEKLKNLEAVRSDIGEDLFRRICASVITEHYATAMRTRHSEVNKTMLHQLVNLHLREIGVEEVSYGFIRRVDRVC